MRDRRRSAILPTAADANAPSAAAKSFSPRSLADIVHVSSLFEGFPDNAVTSVGECAGGPSTAVTIYDLIPLVHRQHYLGDDPTTPISQYDFRKLSYVRRAALALAISDATRQEAIDLLASEPGRRSEHLDGR